MMTKKMVFHRHPAANVVNNDGASIITSSSSRSSLPHTTKDNNMLQGGNMMRRRTVANDADGASAAPSVSNMSSLPLPHTTSASNMLQGGRSVMLRRRSSVSRSSVSTLVNDVASIAPLSTMPSLPRTMSDATFRRRPSTTTAKRTAADARPSATLENYAKFMICLLCLVMTSFLLLSMLDDINRRIDIKNGHYNSAISKPSVEKSSKKRNQEVTYVTEITNLQSTSYVNSTIEYLAQKNEDPDKCSRVYLHLHDAFANNGHGSQMNHYLQSAIISTYLDRAMLLVEPPLDTYKYENGSQFGCPMDQFRDAKTPSLFNFFGDKFVKDEDLSEEFPMGFSRLVQHPMWLSHGCEVPCTDTHGYNDWLVLAEENIGHHQWGKELKEVTCTNSDGKQVNVVAVPHQLYAYFSFHESQMITRDREDAMSQATRLGATPQEADMFAHLNQQNLLNESKEESKVKALRKSTWDYVLGLFNKAGFLKFQPWIASDVDLFLHSFDLPLEEDYTAIHVRRGDKLIQEARNYVIRYWKIQGYSDPSSQPHNYIPFTKYLEKIDGPDKCPIDESGKVQVVKHNVYIATDDPVVIRQEIMALPNHLDGEGINNPTVLYNGCHELKFYFNPTNDTAFHLNGDTGRGFEKKGWFEKKGVVDNCFGRYRRTITSMADLMLLAKAKTFIGDYNSNWGRLVRAMRVQLDAPTGLPKTLDTRVAWGPVSRDERPG